MVRGINFADRSGVLRVRQRDRAGRDRDRDRGNRQRGLGVRRGHGITAVAADHSGVQRKCRRRRPAARRQQGLEVPELLDGLGPGRGGHGHQHAAGETGRGRGRPERPPGRHLHRLPVAAIVPVRAAQVAVVPRQTRQDER